MQAKSILFGDRNQVELMFLRSSDSYKVEESKGNALFPGRGTLSFSAERQGLLHSNSCPVKPLHTAGLKGIRNEHPH